MLFFDAGMEILCPFATIFPYFFVYDRFENVFRTWSTQKSCPERSLPDTEYNETDSNREGGFLIQVKQIIGDFRGVQAFFTPKLSWAPKKYNCLDSFSVDAFVYLLAARVQALASSLYLHGSLHRKIQVRVV